MYRFAKQPVRVTVRTNDKHQQSRAMHFYVIWIITISRDCMTAPSIICSILEIGSKYHKRMQSTWFSLFFKVPECSSRIFVLFPTLLVTSNRRKHPRMAPKQGKIEASKHVFSADFRHLDVQFSVSSVNFYVIDVMKKPIKA